MYVVKETTMWWRVIKRKLLSACNLFKMVFEGFLLYGFYIDFNIDTIRLFRIREKCQNSLVQGWTRLNLKFSSTFVSIDETRLKLFFVKNNWTFAG